MSIREQLEESQAIGSRAKSGPWYANDRGIGYEVGASPVVPGSTEWPEAINDGFRETFSESDATFIAHARTALPVRNAQIEAVLALEPAEINGGMFGYEIHEAEGYNEALRDIRRAIEDAAP